MDDKIKGYNQEGFTTFCCNKIKTKIVNGVEKKDINPPIGHQKITLENCTAYNNGETLCIGTGARSNLTVLDFDNVDTYNKVISEVKCLKNCRTIKTNKGYHIYFKYNPELKNNSNSFEGLNGVDVRNDSGFVFAPPTSYYLQDGTKIEYIDLGGDIIDIPEYFMKRVKGRNNVENENETKHKDTHNKIETIEIEEEKEELNNELDEIDTFLNEFSKQEKNQNRAKVYKLINDGLLDHKSDNYSDWMEVGLAMKNDFDFELFEHFSKRSNKYTKDGVKKFWNAVKDNKKRKLTTGSLFFWAQQSPRAPKKGGDDIEEEQEKNDDKKVEEENKCGESPNITGAKDYDPDREVAIKVFEHNKKYIIKNQGIIYAYYDNTWSADTKKVFYQFFRRSEVSYEISPKLPPKLIRSATRNWPNYLTQLNLIVEDFQSVDLLNKEKDVLCFLDSYYDFKLGKFIDYKDSDRVIYSTFKVNSNKITDVKEENFLKVRKAVLDVFDDNEELMDETMSFFARALSGHVEDKVSLFMIGERNSGKGFISETLFRSFSGVVGRPNSDELILRKSMESAERRFGFLSDFTEKLITFSNEFKNEEIMDGTLLKTIASGGDTVKYRKSYGLTQEKSITALSVWNTNKMPKIEPIDARENVLLLNMPCKFMKEVPNDGIIRGYTIKQAKDVKEEFVDPEIQQACIKFILSFYKPTKPEYKLLTEANKEDFEVVADDLDSGEGLGKAILDTIEFTSNHKDDRIKRSDLVKIIEKKYCKANTKKITHFLKTYKEPKHDKAGETKVMGTRYWTGIRIIEEREDNQISMFD